ncbi:MAG: DUF2141 domain-containing protein [Polyangiales bacterium]
MIDRNHLARLVLIPMVFTVPGLVGAQDAQGVLTVEVQNIKNDTGQIGCSLFANADGFPNKSDKALDVVFVPPKARKATCVFKNVKPGTYAVSVMHDLDKDGSLDSSLMGRPKEPWAVSNNAPVERFGPPKFDAAKFRFDGEIKTIKVKLAL